jgi:hypothetical protein
MKSSASQNNHEAFGESVISLLDKHGWNSIPKRELVILLIDMAAKANLIDVNAPRLRLAQRLMIAPTTLDSLLRDRLFLTQQAHEFSQDEFNRWAKNNSQTTVDDNKKAQVTFAVKNLADAIRVEAYLESLGLVADYKNNRRLLVLDLSNLVNRLSDQNKQSALDLMLAQEKNETLRKKYREKAAGSAQNLLNLLLGAIREQADKHVGEKTVDLALSLISWTKNRLRN